MITFADMSRVETDDGQFGISPFDVVVIDPETGCEPIDGRGRPIFFLMVNAKTGHALAYDNDTKDRVHIEKHFHLVRKMPQIQGTPPVRPETGAEPPEPPHFGETWKHYNGIPYLIVGLANEGTTRSDKYPVEVIYKTMQGKLRAKRLDDWHRSHSLVKRFAPPG